MPENELEQENGVPTEPTKPASGDETNTSRRKRRTFFNRRNGLMVLVGAAALALFLALFVTVTYRYGVIDGYIKAQFTAKMADIGIVFEAEVFRVTVNPLALELRNATFVDRFTGEKLFTVREATLGLTIQDLYAWQLSRDITVNTTDISGAEIWITFDEEGKSNYSNLVFEDSESNINFRYESMRFTLRDSVVHFGDLSRKISGDANNVQFTLEPEDYDAPDDQKRYRIDLVSTGSTFNYDGSPLNDISLRLVAIADRQGADITQLRLETPIGYSNLSGRLTDWEPFTYELNVESSVDLTQTSNIFPLGATLRGVGNFRGTVSGSGETYRVDGTIDSDSLAADGVFLKALNVNATLSGTNSNYEANGRAVAELLTFDDFRIEFPRLAGNVRGTGTDFRWVGELQAAAASTPSLTLGGLFLSDAVAEYRDQQLIASAGNATAARFSVAEAEFENLRMRDMRMAYRNGALTLAAPGAQVSRLAMNDYDLRDIDAGALRVSDTGDRTEVEIDRLRAADATVGATRLRGLSADNFELVDLPATTDITMSNVRAERLDADGTRVDGLIADRVTVEERGATTVVYSNSVRMASAEAGGAILGSLNIAGVRLTIRSGRVEAVSQDIDAGTIQLRAGETFAEGGTLENVRIGQPVFILEPSGRYRASADMSLGGGIIGNIPLGAATARVNATNDNVELTGLNAEVMDGRVEGQALIALNSRSRSDITAAFTGLDLSKLVALGAGRVIPFEGTTSGNIDVDFAGTNFRTASGTVTADITANAGSDADGWIPLEGRLELDGVNGLFNIGVARLNTANTDLSATGRFDLNGDDSDLGIALRSSDAQEVERLLRVTNISPELEVQLDAYQVDIAGDLRFDAKLLGNVTDPVIDGRASLASLALRGRPLGSVTTGVYVSPAGFELREGLLEDPAGGTVAFNVNVPSGGLNNTSVNATLTNVNASNLLAALPVDLPGRLSDFQGQTSGTVELTGLPNEAQGAVDLTAGNGTIGGQPYDSLRVRAEFSGTRIDIREGEIRVGQGSVTAAGYYDRASSIFDLSLTGDKVPVALALSLLPENESIPSVTGLTDFTATARGEMNRSSTYDINFSGTATNVVVNDSPFGNVTYQGNTRDQQLIANLTAQIDGREQEFDATVNFGQPNMPFRFVHVMDQSPLRPFLAMLPQLRGYNISGIATGRIEFGGDLMRQDADGNFVFSTETLSGTANLTALSLQIEETPLVATEPVRISFNPREVRFDSARFAGGGSNLSIAGVKALTDDGINNLAVDGRVNLSLLNVFPGIAGSDMFFAGYADVAVRLAGVNRNARLSGTADLADSSFATFVGSSRISADRVRGRVLFAGNQAQIERATGYLGGGQFVASGGALFADDLSIASYQLSLNGTNITVPLPEDFITTGDARLEVSGRRIDGQLTTLIAGSILARRSIYSEDIDLANIVGGRGNGSLSPGAGGLMATRFDLSIEGRDALIIRNNIADVTASLSLRLTGTTDNPQISGRITANRGTVFFRNDRYEVQRGVLEFPPNTAIEPIIYLQGETEIQGYQIFVNLSGPLTDTENLSATVRSSPALPQQDVVSLITTGSLANTESGIPTLASTGINTAAEVLTDAIINNPARRATDRLFGLNVFEIDPIISGERANPTARLTVGRQINNNLRVTYSTDLSQDQNQVLALEYRISNRLAFVAQYEQRSLTNVTRNRDNFSFEIRLRRRF
jgi:translocation and assembly module TamB